MTVTQLNTHSGETRKSPKPKGKLMRIWDFNGFKPCLHKFPINYKVKQVAQSREA